MSTHELALSGYDNKVEIDHVDSKKQEPLSASYAPEYLNWSIFKTYREFWKSVLYCYLVAAGAMFDGFAVTVPGSIVAQPAFIRQFGTVIGATGDLELNALHVSAWTACQSAGQIVGMIVGPLASDWRGRKFCMYLLSLILVLAAVLEIVSKEWGLYAASKIFAGMATGMIQSGLTVYIAEVSPVRIRGALLSTYSFTFALGQFAASIGLNVIATDSQYKSVFYSEFAFLGMFLPALIFAPESPWWAARKKDETLAKRCLQRLYGNVPSFSIDEEYKILEHAIDEETRMNGTSTWRQYIECFQGSNGRRLLISFIPLAFQQFVGIALFFGYTTYFFQLAGYPHPFQVSLIQSGILLAFIIISWFVLDIVGRRPLLLGGGIIMAICSLSTGGIAFMETLPGAALVALTCIWTAAYAISAGPIGWAYVAETSNPRLRAKATGLAAAGTCCFGLIFNYTVPIMLSTQQAGWGLKIGLFFGSLSILGVVTMFFFVPETKGRTYPELDEMFNKKVPTRKFGSYITEVQAAVQEERPTA